MIDSSSSLGLIDGNLVVHSNCLDGAGSELLWLRAGGRKSNIFRVSAGEFDRFYNENWQLLDNKPLLLCDVAPKTNSVWIDLLKRTEKTKVLDHHKTSEKFRVQYSSIFEHCFDKCGTMMMWDFLLKEIGVLWQNENNVYYELVLSINRHDLWLYDMNEKDHELALLMRIEGQKQFVDNRFISPTFSNEELSLISFEKKRIQIMTDRVLNNVKIVVPVEGHPGAGLKFGCIFVTEDVSFILNEVLVRNPSVDIALGISHEDGSVSLRSRKGGPDCSVIASAYGGGGHACASGYKISYSIISDLFLDLI